MGSRPTLVVGAAYYKYFFLFFFVETALLDVEHAARHDRCLSAFVKIASLIVLAAVVAA